MSCLSRVAQASVAARRLCQAAVHHNAANDVGHRITLNGFGVEMAVPDTISCKWIHAASSLPPGTAALELGAAFGTAALAALEQGAPCVIANDMSMDHLQVISYKASRLGDASQRLVIVAGTVPQLLREWTPPKPIQVVLAANVFHFLTPSDIHETASRLHWITTPNAKLFVSVDSPWTTAYRPLQSLYHLRKRLGDACPGFCQLPHWLSKRLLPLRLHAVTTYHPMEPETLAALLESAGWRVPHQELFAGDRKGNPAGVVLDGREMTGVIAVKQ